MSTKILVSEAKIRFDHNESKLYLREKYSNRLRVPHGGGLWEITTSLISYLSCSEQEHVILLDVFGNPVQVVRSELLSLAHDTYNSVMSEWLAEHQRLGQFR